MIAENEGAGAEEFDGPKIVRLAKTILGNQFQPEHRPRPGVLDRQHSGHSGKLADVLQCHDKIDLRQLKSDFQPGLELIRLNHPHYVR